MDVPRLECLADAARVPIGQGPPGAVPIGARPTGHSPEHLAGRDGSRSLLREWDDIADCRRPRPSSRWPRPQPCLCRTELDQLGAAVAIRRGIGMSITTEQPRISDWRLEEEEPGEYVHAWHSRD